MLPAARCQRLGWWFGFSFSYQYLMLLADNDFGGLDIFADPGSQRHFAGSFPGELEYFHVLGPVAGCHWILIPSTGDVISLINGEINQIAIGHEDFGRAI